MSNVRVVSKVALLVAALSSTTGCILIGDPDPEDGAGASSSDGGAGAGSETGGAGTGGDSSAGGSPEIGDGVGPSADPSPELTESGAYTCEGCPEAMFDTADVDAGTETVLTVTGKADGQSGQGKFLVVNDLGQIMGGGVLVDPDTGDFEQTIPLFCGASTVKLFFQNGAGTSTFVKHVTTSGCLPSDVRVTVAWDETTHQWTNHLVRFGGSIGDTSSDCHNPVNCYPGSVSTDWGVADDHTDDPVFDTDAFHENMGVEDIYYPGAEDGLTVLIENGGDTQGLTPAGTLYINVHDQPTYVKQIAVLHPKEVLIAAKVDGAAGSMTVLDQIHDCASEWNLGCEADLP